MNNQRENSRDKILEAAFRLLSKKGYANVSMRDIAAEAQVALGLLTYHFRTKENLFTALASKLVSKCFEDVVTAIQAGQSEEERMRLLSDYFRNILTEHPDVMKIFLDFSIQAMWNRSFRFQVTYLFNKLAAYTGRCPFKGAFGGQSRPRKIQRRRGIEGYPRFALRNGFSGASYRKKQAGA